MPFTKFRLVWGNLSALLLIFAVLLTLQSPAPAFADDNEDDFLLFAADEVTILKDEREVTARGRVDLQHQGYRLQADLVTFYERTGEVWARGNVKITDPDGNSLYLDEAKVDKELREGFIMNLRFVFEDGSRLAARDGERRGEEIILNYAVFTPCVICDDHPERPPSWQARAVRIVHNADKKRIYYKNVTLEVLGVPILWLPYLSHPDPSVDRATGFLTPEINLRKELGLVLKVPYYIAINPSFDLTITPIITTKENPVLAGEIRKHLGFGQIQAEGSITYTDKPDSLGKDSGVDDFRGHIFAFGTFDHSKNIRTRVRFELTSDDTYLKRYGFSDVDTLQSEYITEVFRGRSYFSLQSLWFQGLRIEDVQGLTGFALPLIDLNFMSRPDHHGAVYQFRFNGLALHRTDGMDTRRMSIQGSYEIPFRTSFGLITRLGARFRGELYNISNAARPDFAFFAGQNGTEARFLPELTADFEWPFVKTGGKTQQIITPVVNLVVAPTGGNPAGLSNEDSRTFELNDLNILSFNRMPGLDLWEGGTRLNFGFKWLVVAKDVSIETFLGESYRFDVAGSDPEDIFFAPGSGLDGHLSDLVTRFDINIKGALVISNRMRFDESNFQVRRNEIDATVHFQNIQVGVGYYKLNRGLQVQGLQDREEIRIYGNYAFKRYWQVFGHITRNLTTTGATITQGIGVSYIDDCVELSIAWKKSNTTDRDISPGTSILFRLRLKHLG